MLFDSVVKQDKDGTLTRTVHYSDWHSIIQQGQTYPAPAANGIDLKRIHRALSININPSKRQGILQYFLKDLLSEPDSYFDVVLAIDVFEHIEDYLGFLRQLRHKGKYKIFHIPLDLSIYTVLKSSPILRLRASVGHLHYFTKETALATLEDTGYEVLDYFYTNCYLEFPNQGWQTLVRRLPQPFLNCIYHDLTVRLLGGFSLIVLAK